MFRKRKLSQKIILPAEYIDHLARIVEQPVYSDFLAIGTVTEETVLSEARSAIFTKFGIITDGIEPEAVKWAFENKSALFFKKGGEYIPISYIVQKLVDGDYSIAVPKEVYRKALEIAVNLVRNREYILKGELGDYRLHYEKEKVEVEFL